jgi:tetratricopeptide (TPR) repeat protein
MTTVSIAGQPNQQMAIAKTQVDKGDLEGAIKTYKSLIHDGVVSAELFYNLGNTFLQADSIASAVLNYERALRIDPTDSDILNNLEIARGRVEDQVTVLQEFFLFEYWSELVFLLSANGWATLSILILAMCAAFYYFLAYRGLALRQRHLWSITGALIAAFIFSLTAGIARKHFSIDDKAAIVMSDFFMKSGPDDRSEDLKVLHKGYKIFLLDELNGWKKVRTEDREEGWVKPDIYEVI